ncbi:MAG: hypothetical protein MJ095_07910 [Oscillospiraceae bacterium]|nr:hypothetical protein [Oscillospiraceae bacterium]
MNNTESAAKQTARRNENSAGTASGRRRKRKRRRTVNLAAVVPALLIVTVFIVNLCINSSTVKKGSKAFMNAYETERDAAAPTVYEDFFKSALEQYRTKNEINTEIPTENYDGKIEVFRICDTACIPQTEDGNDDPTAYLEVPCTGVYTVNLNYTEFITDLQRNSVTLRIPRPELTEFTVDTENAKLKNGQGIIISNSKMTSSEYIQSHVEENDPVIRESILNNTVFTENACEAAKKRISQIIMAYNPFESIDAEVEFIN